jgi:hypothetical protein
MTTIEDRLQELRHTVGLPTWPGLPDVEELAGRAAWRRRRHRRRRLAVAGVVAVAVLVPAVVVARQEDDPDTRVGSESPDQTGPPATTPLPASGIPIVLVATNMWDGSLVVEDLDAGVRSDYADGEHVVDYKTPEDFAESGPNSASARHVIAALTVDGKLIAGVMPDPLVVFAPGQSLSEPGRQLPGTAGWRAFLPTEGGDALWVTTGSGVLVLFDLATGQIRLSLDEVGATSLVGVTGDHALLHDGYNNQGRVRMVSPSGEVTLAEPPAGALGPGVKASFVGASPTRSAWLLDSQEMPPGWTRQGLGQTVLIVGPGGDTTEIPILEDDGSLWTWEGSQTGIGAMRTLTADGTRLLVNIAAPGDTIPTQLAVVDLVAGTARVVYEGGGEGFWAADDRTAVLLTGDGSGSTAIVAVDTDTGTATTVDHLDPRSQVIAAA